jgi:F-type H+-transporting ATPase subunit alpha
MPVEEEIISIYAGVNGYLKNINIKDIHSFEQKSIEYLHNFHQEYFDEIIEKKIISDELDAKLKDFYQKFAASFIADKEKA